MSLVLPSCVAVIGCNVACYSPIRGVLSISPDGKKQISFRGLAHGKPLSLPCGRCIGCRLERARQWAVRIMHESKMHDFSWFVTLTYDDEHLPHVEGRESLATLSIRDVQLFLKRLRERVSPARIRFFLCGEYGEVKARPHYHAVIFGVDFPDKVLLKGSGELSLWTSRLLSESWGNGNASIGSLSFDSASYVANYSTKKIVGPQAKEFYQGRKPEFLLMSRRPGIGAKWYEKFQTDVFPSDEVIVRGMRARPPRYYGSILEKRDPVSYGHIRLKREAFASALEEFMGKDGKSVLISPSRNARRLEVREKVARAKLAIKRRSLESE